MFDRARHRDRKGEEEEETSSLKVARWSAIPTPAIAQKVANCGR